MEPNHPSSPHAASAEAAYPSLVSDSLDEACWNAGRHRHDGWTPERLRAFLETLAACGVVADACRAAGMSPQSAYALRNRRAGRAFAAMWDAVQVHRARARMEGELMSRALCGCVERVEAPDGTARERHRYDNRLSMAMLTRLDRLAESKADQQQALRALSEDFEDFLDEVEAGGDLDAFVAERMPCEPAAPEPAADRPRRPPMDDYDRLAALTGCSDWRDVPFTEIPVADLDPSLKEEWDEDAIVRAGRSHYLDWLAMAGQGGTLPDDPADCPAAYEAVRAEIVARMEAQIEAGQPSTSSTLAAAPSARKPVAPDHGSPVPG